MRAGILFRKGLSYPDPVVDWDANDTAADNENTIVRGLSAERYPARYSGGIGEEGLANPKKYVNDAASSFVLTIRAIW